MVNYGNNANEFSTSGCCQFTSGGKIIVLFVLWVEWSSHPDLVRLEKTKTQTQRAGKRTAIILYSSPYPSYCNDRKMNMIL